MHKKRMNRIMVLLAIILFFSSITSAKTEYSVKESRNCPYCHSSDGPPQLNERGVYYGTHNHSLEGFVPSPIATGTPEQTEKIEIGVHMQVWDVGLIAVTFLLLMLGLIYAIRL